MSDRAPRSRERARAAAEWAVRRREGLTALEGLAFERWLAEHPENAHAIRASEAVWADLGDLELRALDGEAHAAERRRTRLAGAGAARWAAMAAGLVLVMAAGFVAVRAAGEGRRYSSGQGEVRAVTLADGSVVTLGAGSEIAVRFAEDGRRVVLRRGEALFDVRHDPSRPFFVRAADTRVTVLGTRFTVKAAPDRVRVDVIQGVVRVEKAPAIVVPFAPRPASTEEIIRGERVESPKGRDLAPLKPVQPTEVAAWTKGRLVYENVALREVVSDLNRYGPLHIEIGASALGDLRVTAAFRQDQIHQFLDSLPASLPVDISRTSEDVLVIRPSAEGG